MMSMRDRKIGLFLSLVMIAGVFSIPARAGNQTFTGMVGDAMCGPSHVMSGGAADCTRECVARGSKYALVIGDKVYLLDVVDKALLEAIDKLAGDKVTITGTKTDDRIAVTSVKAAR